MIAFVLESIGTLELMLIVFVLIFVVGIVLILTKITKTATANQKTLKDCPYCAELIQSEAIVCRYCNRDLK